MVDVPQPIVGTTPEHVLYRIMQNSDFALLTRRECGEHGAAEIRPPFELELVPSEGGRLAITAKKMREEANGEITQAESVNERNPLTFHPHSSRNSSS